MADRDVPVTVYLTEAEKSKLSRWADKSDKSISQLCRDAILEYTDRDRTERIESEVRRIDDKLDRVLTLMDGEHTHTRGGSDSSQSVPEKARNITRRLYENHDMPVNHADVEIAIEDIAGGDDRTLEQYYSQLKKRGLLYEHPVSPVWTDDKEEYVSWVENATHNPDAHDATQEYGMSITEYDEIAEKVTTEQ